MKAITLYEYGSPDVLKFEEVEKPTPKVGEVLVKVHAAAANAADIHLMHGTPFLVRLMIGGLRKPNYHILGSDIAGRVEAVGANVTQWKVGDEVFGASNLGGFAEYVCAKAELLVSKPSALTFEQAAGAPMAAFTALQALRDQGKLQAGQKVLINGASGGVGSFAVQIAKLLGAEVTAVCSTRNIEIVRTLGADHVIDYTQTNFTQNGQQYDVILAANGYHPITAYKRALRPNGIYVMVGGTNPQLFEALLLGPLMSIGTKKQMKVTSAKSNPADLLYLRDLLEAGQLISVIDQCYPLQDGAQAMRYLDAGHARGKVILQMG